LTAQPGPAPRGESSSAALAKTSFGHDRQRAYGRFVQADTSYTQRFQTSVLIQLDLAATLLGTDTDNDGTWPFRSRFALSSIWN